MTRPSREQIHMETAILWGKRSTCKRPNRKIGCVITSENMRQILAFGYCGPPKGLPNDSCKGSDCVGFCGCSHSEVNAITFVDGTITNKKLFVSMSPCYSCAVMISQANISEVYFAEYYRNTDGLELLEKCGIKTYFHPAVDIKKICDTDEI